jgi:DNA end-binding protein Ku
VKAGDTETVIQPEEEAPDEGAQVIDLTELLARSLKSGKSAKVPARSASEQKDETKQQPARKAAAKKVTPVVGSSVRMPRVLRTGLVEDTTVQTVITSSCS